MRSLLQSVVDLSKQAPGNDNTAAVDTMNTRMGGVTLLECDLGD